MTDRQTGKEQLHAWSMCEKMAIVFQRSFAATAFDLIVCTSSLFFVRECRWWRDEELE
jgi:hypothetical protein